MGRGTGASASVRARWRHRFVPRHFFSRFDPYERIARRGRRGGEGPTGGGAESRARRTDGIAFAPRVDIVPTARGTTACASSRRRVVVVVERLFSSARTNDDDDDDWTTTNFPSDVSPASCPLRGTPTLPPRARMSGGVRSGTVLRALFAGGIAFWSKAAAVAKARPPRSPRDARSVERRTARARSLHKRFRQSALPRRDVARPSRRDPRSRPPPSLIAPIDPNAGGRRRRRESRARGRGSDRRGRDRRRRVVVVAVVRARGGLAGDGRSADRDVVVVVVVAREVSREVIRPASTRRRWAHRIARREG